MCIWKDWPPATDFKTTFPFSTLCTDLLQTLPVPDVLRPDGCRNAISYFPGGRAKPDLGKTLWKAFMPMRSRALAGPKIYAALRDKDCVGSTRLHGDVADAFNICTHGEAIWIAFACNDAGKVNEYVVERTGKSVHEQRFFSPLLTWVIFLRKKGSGHLLFISVVVIWSLSQQVACIRLVVVHNQHPPNLLILYRFRTH
jgi:hypothetical protein